MKKYIYLAILGTFSALGALGAADAAVQVVQEQVQLGKNRVQNCYTTTDDKGNTTTECIIAKMPRKEKPTQVVKESVGGKDCYTATYRDGSVVTECVGG